MFRIAIIAVCFAILAGCSSKEPDQEAIDSAVEQALAERDREDAARYNTMTQEEQDGDAQDDENSPEEEPQKTSYSTESLRDGYSKDMGSPYWMCTRTLSIVGEHCGCMVNRATDAGIPNAAQVGMFGGDGKRATEAQAEKFTRIVRSCSGYNITVRGTKASQEADEVKVVSDETKASGKGRVVTCEFESVRDRYKGPCEFVMGPGGSFTTRSLDGPYYGNVYDINLIVESRGVGSLVFMWPDVRGDRTIMRQSNSAVQRDQSDRACWSNAQIRFCAR
ncbi:MAG: hypothetical protein AAGH53_08265 [Pseudomonadota bacterium]